MTAGFIERLYSEQDTGGLWIETAFDLTIKRSGKPDETWQNIQFTEPYSNPSAKRKAPVQVLAHGDINTDPSPLCRIDSYCSSGQELLSTECDCLEQFDQARTMIVQEGSGLIVRFTEDDGRGFGAAAYMKVKKLVRALKPVDPDYEQNQAYIDLYGSADNRDYSLASIALRALGVSSVRLLGQNQDKADALTASGIEVASHTPLVTSRTDLSKYI